MPAWIDPARLALAIVNHPALGTVIGLVKHVALIVLANPLAFAPREKLSAKRLPVPPRDCTKKRINNSHLGPLATVFIGMPQGRSKV